MMKIKIDGQKVSLSELRGAWQSATTVSIGKTAAARINESNAHIKTVLASGEQVYGVNTGFGQLAQVRVSDDELAHLQENLVRSHSVGVGEDLPDDCVRLIMIMKVIALAQGCSGVPTRFACSLITFVAARLVPTKRILLPRVPRLRNSSRTALKAGTVFSRLIMWILLREPKMNGAILGFQKRV